MKTAPLWTTSLATQQLPCYAGMMTALPKAPEQVHKPAVRHLWSPDTASLLGGSGPGHVGSCPWESCPPPQFLCSERGQPLCHLRWLFSCTLGESHLLLSLSPLLPLIGPLWGAGVGLWEGLGGHWWLSTEALPLAPELSCLLTLRSTTADQRPTCASHWHRL